MRSSKDNGLFSVGELVDRAFRGPNDLRSPPGAFDADNNELSERLTSINLGEIRGLHENGGDALSPIIGSSLAAAIQEEEEEDDDIDQLNIDEVDQVRGEVLDNNLAVDEEFQHSLNERASQFTSLSEGNSINTNSFPSVPKPKVDYQYNDNFNLQEELNDWFTANELKRLPHYKKIFTSCMGVSDFLSLNEIQQAKVVQVLIKKLSVADDRQNVLNCLVYISLGMYGHYSNFNQHIQSIKKYNGLLAKNNIIPKLIEITQESFNNTMATKGEAVCDSNILLLSLTLLYFMICCEINDNDNQINSIVSDQLQEGDFLLLLVKFVDDWRWNSLPQMRIRKVLAVFAKSLQLLLGGFDHRSQTKDYLFEKLGIIKEINPTKLTTTPLDYYVFREDLLARYPISIPPPSTLPPNFENTSSLSQFINIPRTLETSKANSSLPVPSVHITTPAPSPPSTPVNKTNKVKRSYQTNQSYPLIYPTSDQNRDVENFGIPKSIEEASQLFASRVQEKLSLKQLWNERDIFMKQERGWTDTLSSIDQNFDDYAKLDTSLKPELQSLLRVETFFSRAVPYLSSLVHVILQVVISSQENNQFLGDDSKEWSNQLDCEVICAKERALKNGMYILMLLLKWLKISHILKFEYLSTLIYDSNYFAIMIQYLKSMGGSSYARITNTSLYDNMPYSFWSQCSACSTSPYHVPAAAHTIDERFCFSLTSLLTIGAFTCHKKTQRILALSEKDPARLFKPFFLMVNDSLWKPILKMIKEITPFNGRKWKSYNMDLISMVYLHMKPQLRENWLSGRDLDGELKDAYGQEIALRAIIQFYNLRRYSESMNELGYEKRGGDFFSREMELFSIADV